MLVSSSLYGVLDQARPVNWGSRLTDRLCLWNHFGLQTVSEINGEGWFDLTRRPEGATRQVNSVSSTRGTAKPGIPGALVLTNGAGYLQTPWPWVAGQTMDDVFTNATQCTVLVVARWRDTTLRDSAFVGVDGGFPTIDHRIVAHTWGDGNIYFDYGGTTEGATRLTAAYTKDLDWHWWAFTVGGGEGMRIYRDGALIASNSATPTRNLARGRVLTTGTTEFGGVDNVDIAEVAGFNRAMPQGEVVAWMRQSQAGHPDTLDWRRPNFGLTYRGTQAAPPPGGVLGSVFGGNIIRSGSRLAF